MPAAREPRNILAVLVVDDHAIIRSGLKEILAQTHDMRVAGEAENGVHALQMLRTGRWDIVLLDISMPDRNGLETLKLIRKEHPKLPAIMLSMHEEEFYAVRSLKAGAQGYLCKDTAAEKLVEAIRTVAAGRRYISAEVAEQLANAVLEDDATSGRAHERLSDREYQTLRLIASGHTLTEIAAQMKLSVKTVSVYRSRVLEKMKLRTNAELTYYGVKNGLVASPPGVNAEM